MVRKSKSQQREDKKNLILCSARKVFHEKGYSSVTMKDIIAACGISRGGIYLYYASVKEIFLDVIASRNASRFEEIRQAVQENIDFSILIQQYFQKQKERMINVKESLLRATYEFHFTHQSDEEQQFQKAQLQHVKNTIMEIMMLGVRQQKIAPENAEAIGENIMFVIEGLSVFALLGGLTEQYIDTQFSLFTKLLFQKEDIQ